MKKVALEGAINGCSDAKCNDWRAYVISKLGGKVNFHNPMDFDCRGLEAEMEADLIHFDMMGMMSSDIFIVMAETPSWGTAMAVQMGWEWDKCIVSVCLSDKPSPWLKNRSTHMVKTIDDAIALVETLL